VNSTDSNNSSQIANHFSVQHLMYRRVPKAGLVLALPERGVS